MEIKELLNKRSKVFGFLIKLSWASLIALFLLIPFYIFTVNIDLFGLYGGMPSIKVLENPENDLSSELISADGVSLGRYFRYNRSPLRYEDLSEDLVNTLLLSEDHRFYDHSGMDFIAYLRVLKGILTFSRQGGGSTLTQQLAKNLFNTRGEQLEGKIARLGRIPRIVVGKTKEWIIATYLERNFTKKEIIAMYLNTAEFGSNAYGIKTASETFFAKSADSLNLQESAVLIGLLQAITQFNPVRNPDNSLAKRNEVLYKIYKHGYKLKTREAYDSIKALPIDLEYSVQNQNKGLATYFRSVIRTDLLAWCKENGYDLFEDGLKVHTTIDSRMQGYAEQAINEHMAALQKVFERHWGDRNPWLNDNRREIKGFVEKRAKNTDHYRKLAKQYGKNSDSIKVVLNRPRPMTVFSWTGEIDTLMSPMDSIRYYKRFLHTGFMSMDPHSGSIKAWVGGINHKYFKYDHVRQGKRQPGSTFKPFVYGAALQEGYYPCYQVEDLPVTFQVVGDPPTWTPPNANRKYTGDRMTLRKALANSVNSITAYLMREIGPENVVRFAQNMGIDSPLDAVPSLCLGVSDVSLFELTGAYSTFANEGIHTRPYYITRIEDKNGNVIENFVPKTRQAISEELAYLMIHMLKGGVEEEGGSSRGLSWEVKANNEIGGKTGTTNNASDGWYMGLTKDLVTGIWVGGDEKSIHFRDWSMGQGSRTARPIWDRYMQKIYKDKELGYEKGAFKRPMGGINVALDCSRYGNQGQANDSIQNLINKNQISEDDIF